MTTFRVEPGGVLKGSLRVPGDKSISHRAIMLGSIAEGRSEVHGFLEGADALATMNAFRAMGVAIDGPHAGRVSVQGAGMRGLRDPVATIDCGNSGTSMRLLCGLLSGAGVQAKLSGDASLSRRPMRRVAEPLARMGATIATGAGGRPPLLLHSTQTLRGIDFEMPVASAQVKSALLLAGLFAEGRTCVVEPAPTRDHTERMLQAFGVAVASHGGRACVNGGARLAATRIDVPADISSAAFFLVAASIAPGSELVLTEVGVNPTRTGVLAILRLMGADIEIMNERVFGGEPVADIRVRGARLRGIAIPPALVPLAIDEFPALFVAAANAEGETILTGAEELRVKESDRIAVMAEGLAALGVEAEPRPDGIRIRGGRCRGGTIDSHGDHRIAMSFAVAGLAARAPITIRDCANVATSFPGFVDRARAVGLQIAAVDAGAAP